jgi:signal recognition particle receptor subunit alpha
MQDNEPLMRALSALIVTNEPDLVLFVGEALVGNDAVDQLSKFKVGWSAGRAWRQLLAEC